jgi:hypothetical protein
MRVDRPSSSYAAERIPLFDPVSFRDVTPCHETQPALPPTHCREKLSPPALPIGRPTVGSVGVKAKVWNVEKPERAREVLPFAGTGAVYTILPRSLLE